MSPPTLVAFDGESFGLEREDAVPSVVVVDPQFENYKPLAGSARQGKLKLHFRSSAADALKLARRLRVDAWLIAPELDDMSGPDFLELLQARFGEARVAMVEPATPGSARWEETQRQGGQAGAAGTLSPPITFGDLEQLLDLPTQERAVVLTPEAVATAKPLVTLPIAVSAAAVAMAVLMLN